MVPLDIRNYVYNVAHDEGYQMARTRVAIWDAIETKTRTSSGYASVLDVAQADPHHIDSMPRCVPGLLFLSGFSC